MRIIEASLAVVLNRGLIQAGRMIRHWFFDSSKLFSFRLGAS